MYLSYLDLTSLLYFHLSGVFRLKAILSFSIRLWTAGFAFRSSRKCFTWSSFRRSAMIVNRSPNLFGDCLVGVLRCLFRIDVQRSRPNPERFSAMEIAWVSTIASRWGLYSLSVRLDYQNVEWLFFTRVIYKAPFYSAIYLIQFQMR